MKNLLNKMSNVAIDVALFCVGCVMAAMGLAFLGLMAMVGFALAALALLVSPFLARAEARAPSAAAPRAQAEAA